MSNKNEMTTDIVARSVKYSLRFVGSWPDVPYAFFSRCAWALIIGLVQACQYWYIFIHIQTDELSKLMDGLSVTLEYSVMFGKLIVLWFNNRIFYNVLTTMVTDWREVTVNDTHVMTSKANLSRNISNIIIALHTSGTIFFGVGTMLSYISYEDNANGTQTRELLMKLKLPFDYNVSPLYEIVTCLQFIHQIAGGIINGTLNSLIVTLVLHASGQIDILCRGLRKISPEQFNRPMAVSIVSQLVGKHQRIIAFSNKLEQIFCYMALIQFMCSSVIICCVGIMIVTSISRIQESDINESSNLMKSMLFYLTAIVEAYVFCVCGEYLSAKSKMIGDAAYKSFWYELEPRDSKFILFIMMRSEKRFTITAGKIMDLSLEGFTNIIKGSMSYISVLHAMD